MPASRRIARMGAVVFLATLFLIVAAANLGIGREYYGWWIDSFPGNDILGHFLLMGTLSFMVNYSLAGRQCRIGSWRPQLGTVSVGALVTAEEFSQIFLPNRSFSFGDLAADMAGIVFFGWLAARMSARERRETR